MRNRFLNTLIGLALVAGLAPAAQAAVRIKDITDLEGARPNQLVGIGLVVGLDGTGGRSSFTQQVAVDMLQRFRTAPVIVGINRADAVYRSGSVSVVTVIADLGPFSRRGSKLDIIVSVLDDATSLQGGTLILTPLKGADGVDYAVAQGPLSIGGFNFTAFNLPVGTNTSTPNIQRHHTSVGRISGGAIVEREARGEILCNGQIRLLLREPDYVTARTIAEVINKNFPDSALTLDAGTVQVMVPKEQHPSVVAFAAEIGLLEVAPDTTAKVVINERTGTIVAGENVRIATVAVAHGNLAISTSDQPVAPVLPALPAPQLGPLGPVPPPGPGAAPAPDPTQPSPPNLRVMNVKQTTTVADLAGALNALGATPRDLITIFQALKRAGALHAELVIM